MKREYIITYEEAYADGVYFAHPIGELGQEIIRCGECKLSGTENCPMDEMDDEYFCNFGEREGE